jgi:hypothetical protein
MRQPAPGVYFHFFFHNSGVEHESVHDGTMGEKIRKQDGSKENAARTAGSPEGRNFLSPAGEQP